MIKGILNQLNKNNSSNYKKSILLDYFDNELLKRVCAMTYDRVKYTYGISLKNIPEYTTSEIGFCELEGALDILEDKFVTREWTGNKAITELHAMLSLLSTDDATVVELIIRRDLRINIGKTIMNKVWPKLITDPPYMRCCVYSEKTAEKISWPAILQLKADGTYRHVTVRNNEVRFSTRSGEEAEFPLLEEEFIKLPDGVYIGELLVEGELNRSLANGLINSDNPPHDRIYIQLWDYVSIDEFYYRPKDSKNKTPYDDRFDSLLDIQLDNICPSKISIIPTRHPKNIEEALKQTSSWMSEGYEGSILKDYANIFRDCTSPTQLKLKVEIEVDVRCVGFTEGTKGTKREKTFGAIMFENDEGDIKGRVAGIKESMIKKIHENRDDYINKVFSLKCNDITKGRNNDYYALSHPRFGEFRDDKDTTDTLERVLELKEMALTLGEKKSR